MAVSYNDKYVLSTDSGFQNRVREALLTYCATVANEASNTPFHTTRIQRAVGVINSPDNFKAIYANAAAMDAGVIGDATQAGTVSLTSTNVAAQAALVTDAHLDAAIQAQFNYFVVPV